MIVQVLSRNCQFLRVPALQQLRFSSNMAIKEGDALPSIDLFEKTPGTKVNIKDLVGDKKAVLFAVPGAFTPGCSKTHLPGYVEKFPKLKEKGVEAVVCVSVNDPFVMDEWGKAHKADQVGIRMLGDPQAKFTKAVGLDLDLTEALGNVRSKRYAMIVEGGKVKKLFVEPDNTGLTCSLADPLLENL